MIYIFIFICLVDPEILHNNQHGLIGFDAYSSRIPERLKRNDIIYNVFSDALYVIHLLITCADIYRDAKKIRLPNMQVRFGVWNFDLRPFYAKFDERLAAREAEKALLHDFDTLFIEMTLWNFKTKLC